MDMRQLRYFVAAVEEGALQGAAQRMNVAQPALSRRIRDLEASLSSELLIRGPRGVAPTPAGTTLYQEAVVLLDRFDQAERRARRAGLNQERVVRFGLVPSARKYPFTQAAVASFTADRPSDQLAFTRGASLDLAAALRAGRLDLSLLYERHLGTPAFEERLIHREMYVVAVHPSHRLAMPQPMALADLSGEPLIWLSRRETEGEQDQLMQQCRLHGLEPVIAASAGSHEEQIDLTVVSGGLCLTPASTILSTPGDMLLFRPLPQFAMELHLSLAWSRDLAGSPAGELLSHMHGAIDRHQTAIGEGHAAWARLHGHAVVRISAD